MQRAHANWIINYIEKWYKKPLINSSYIYTNYVHNIYLYILIYTHVHNVCMYTINKWKAMIHAVRRT